MAKVTITFEDGEGEVVITTSFDPPASMSEPVTPAQRTAMDVHDYLARQIQAEAAKEQP